MVDTGGVKVLCLISIILLLYLDFFLRSSYARHCLMGLDCVWKYLGQKFLPRKTASDTCPQATCSYIQFRLIFLLLDDGKRFLCATYESIGSGVTPWLTSFNNTAAVLHSLLWCRVTNTSFWKTLHVAFRHEGIVQEGLVLQDYTIDVLHQGILIYLESIYIHLQDCIQQIKRMSFNRFYSYVILSLIFCSSIFSLSILWSSILFSMIVMLLIPCAQLFDILYHFFTKLILN